MFARASKSAGEFQMRCDTGPLLLTRQLSRTFLTPRNEIHVQVETLKPATHLAILYTDHGDRRKSPGVPGAAMAIFGDRRIKSPISGMSDIGD